MNMLNSVTLFRVKMMLKNGFFIHVFAGLKLKMSPASKLASDFEAFDLVILILQNLKKFRKFSLLRGFV